MNKSTNKQHIERLEYYLSQCCEHRDDPPAFRAAIAALQADDAATPPAKAEAPPVDGMDWLAGWLCKDVSEADRLGMVYATADRLLQAVERLKRAAAPATHAGKVDALMERAYEVVHHDVDCPAIGGNGDDDCRCDAVSFLSDLQAALATLHPEPVQGESVEAGGCAPPVVFGDPEEKA